ncbi:peptidyl-tRNA hydrolase Pth2 [Candidatus Undinarchaeota archaeon]
MGQEKRKLANIITGEVKQVIILRKDLKLSKGKSSAQASHASVSAFLKCKDADPESSEKWLATGQKKVVLAAANKTAMIALQKKAEKMGICSALIQDAGRTEIKAGTTTALAIGPAPEKEIDEITGQLSLY